MSGSLKSRGQRTNLPGRFAERIVIASEPAANSVETIVTSETARSIVSTNRSPDVPFDRSINPYRGCEHGCVYCYARPSHSYLDLSPGLDFETKILAKDNAAELLETYLSRPRYRCQPITLGANTDPYQPVERQRRLTRRLLAVCRRFRQPISIVTKGTLIIRDIDMLAPMAARGLCRVAVSVPTANATLKRTLEPRVPSAGSRFRAIETLTAAGIPVTLMVAPLIPALTDNELEKLLERGASAGADTARYVLLRLPHEVAPLFRSWLGREQPLKAKRIMNRMRELGQGSDYDARFGHRQTGNGVFAQLLKARFETACRRLGLNTGPTEALNCDDFRRPDAAPQQSFDFG